MIRKLVIFFQLLVIPLSADDGKFILLLGPSGVGKSTIIAELQKLDDRFTYVKPYTTRELRPGETEKIHVSRTAIDEMERKGDLLTVNEIYGIYYATPKNLIDQNLLRSAFPILDWPADKMSIMLEHYPDRLFVIYLAPDNLPELYRRLQNDHRDNDGIRYLAGIEEMKKYQSGCYDKFLNLKIINRKGMQKKIAYTIYEEILKSTGKK